MRIALILLSIIALVFIGMISWSLLGQGTDGGEGISLSIPRSNTDTLALETWKNQIKTEQKIEELNAKIAELTQTKEAFTGESPDGSGSIIKISGKLLSLLMPTVSLKQVPNNGIFDLHLFDASISYSTYEDSALGLTIIPLGASYDVFLKNMKAIDNSVYSINEITTFPFRAFFVNPPKTDTLARLVIESETQTVILIMPKSKYPQIRELLDPNKK